MNPNQIILVENKIYVYREDSLINKILRKLIPGGKTIKELNLKIGSSNTNTSHTLKLLLEKGYIEKLEHSKSNGNGKKVNEYRMRK